MTDDHARSVAKGATWRAIGTFDTIVLSLIFTGHIDKALKIGGVELFTKIGLYYLHERIWMRLLLGTEEHVENGHVVRRERHHRSVIKGISWRMLGSLDTFWIAFFINRNSAHAVQTASYIAATEVVSKIFLFWLHERAWMRIAWGRKQAPAAAAETVQPG